MALVPGTRLGVYEVTAQIGQGGMGEVYRATDTKLKRQVAIKILPSSLAADPDRLARFQREAEVLASLNHPSIAHIHGLEEGAGSTSLIMELVEGEDLSQRIARGAIPIEEALPIAKQIAEALEAAHEQGIIHRDLKPANIKVRSDGTVKVLDFGLAKALDQGLPASGRGSGSAPSPTMTSPAMTQAGMILGTAAYMSPEQAKGRTVDRRADVWSFGVVLFEMLAGTQAFDGEGVSETLARVIEREPDWNKLPATLSPGLRACLERCLRKDPRQRIRDIGDVRLALEGAFDPTHATSSATAVARSGRSRWFAALAVAALAIVVLAIVAVRHLLETPPSAPLETRVDIVAPATDHPTSFALSPDGRQIVFVASSDGVSRLWLRSLATTTAQPLAGTEGATFPFWAPNGRAVAFFAASELKRIEVGGGVPQTLATAPSGRGGAWHADGFIVFAPNLTTPLMRVSATGGAAVPITTLGPQQTSHRWPHLLPDGRRFLFYAQAAPDGVGIHLGALDGGTPVRLTPSDSAGLYLPAGPEVDGAVRGDGWLLWARAGTLVGQRLDVAQAVLTGDLVTLADGVTLDIYNRSAFAVSATGLVAYRTGEGHRRQLTWVDRSGTARGTVGVADGSMVHPRVSADGRVAVVRMVQGNNDLWLLEGDRTSRVTFDAAFDLFPLWSPDGSRIAFNSNRVGPYDLYLKPTSGAGIEERLETGDQSKFANSWTKDGRFLLYHRTDSQTGTDLWVLPMVGDRKPLLFLKTPFVERWGAFSPDGQWVAYQSDESGRAEIYVRPFVPPGATETGPLGGQWQISTAGGVYPAWRPDGKELYYLNPAGVMMAATVTVTRSTLQRGTPVTLFPTRILGGVDGWQYDVAPDGRFLINTVLDGTAAPITLLQNWHPLRP